MSSLKKWPKDPRPRAGWKTGGKCRGKEPDDADEDPNEGKGGAGAPLAAAAATAAAMAEADSGLGRLSRVVDVGISEDEEAAAPTTGAPPAEDESRVMGGTGDAEDDEDGGGDGGDVSSNGAPVLWVDSSSVGFDDPAEVFEFLDRQKGWQSATGHSGQVKYSTDRIGGFVEEVESCQHHSAIKRRVLFWPEKGSQRCHNLHKHVTYNWKFFKFRALKK
jgi:hypothetical protein